MYNYSIVPNVFDNLAGFVPGGGGAGGEAPWILVDGWGSLVDTVPYSTTGTTHDGNGLVTIVYAGDTTIYDGYREAAPAWEVAIQSIPGMESWQPTNGVLQILFKPTVAIDTGAVGDAYGISVVVADNTLANLATSNGIGYRIHRFNASLNQVQNIVATAGSGATSSTTADYFLLSFTPTMTASGNTTLLVATQGHIGSGVWENYSGATGVNMTGTGSSHYLRVKGHHGSTTTNPGLTVTAKVWVRWLKSVEPLEGIS